MLIDRLTVRADTAQERFAAESQAVAARLLGLDELTSRLHKEQQINFNIHNLYRGISPDPPAPKEESNGQKRQAQNESDEDEDAVDFLKDNNIKTYNALLSYMLHGPQ